MIDGWRRSSAIFAAFVVLAAAYTWPLLPHVRSLIPSDPGDPAFNTFVLWWNATRLPFSAGWWNAPQFFPTQGVAAFTENLAGISPTFDPVFWLTREPLTAYNVAYFLTWPLSAFAAFVVVRQLTGRDDAALLAGLAYGFSPYRTTGLAQIQTLASYWMPFCLLGLHAFLETRRRRWLVLFAVSWLLQSLANGHYMLFGGVLIVLWLAYFCSTREHWRAGVGILLAWAVASLPLAAIMNKYRQIHEQFGLFRTENEILAFSATPDSWLQVSGDVWLWRGMLPDGKDDLFPGLAAIVIVITALAMAAGGAWPPHKARFRRTRIGLAAVTLLSMAVIAVSLYAGPWSVSVAGIPLRVSSLDRALVVAIAAGISLCLLTPRMRAALEKRSAFVFYTAAVLTIALLCCGPVLRVNGEVMLDPAPYRLLLALPGFDQLRMVTRFWMLGILCLSIAAGLAFHRVRLLTPSKAAATGLLLASAAGVLADGWMPIMRMAAPPDRWSDIEARDRTEPLLELPLGPDWDFAATFRAIDHERRVINGVSGYNPPYYVALTSGLASRDPAMLEALASLGSYEVIVNGAADHDAAIDRYVAKARGATLAAQSDSRRVYRIPQGSWQAELGPVIPIVKAEAVRQAAQVRFVFDGRIETGWGDFPQQGDQWLSVELSGPRQVGGVSHAIGDYVLDFPRRLAIELSSNGAQWDRVWEGPTAAPTVLAYIRAPREARLRFAFQPRTARFVRLLQLESYPSMWRVSEVQIHAPPGQ
jgi:hypothetical protein